jgi:NAD(P)-dependent dehydrogenase (short-subunit alcohol dehydrogenase family)
MKINVVGGTDVIDGHASSPLQVMPASGTSSAGCDDAASRNTQVERRGALAGKTAFVTGGYGAIALASATLLARDGAAVVLMGRRHDALEQACATLLGEVAGAKVTLIVGDACAEADLAFGLSAAQELAGGLDIVVATVGGGAFRPLMQLDAPTLKTELDLNIGSAFLAIRHGAALMRPGGAIVCISSTAAKMPFRYLAAYHVAKAGVEALVRAAAQELGAAGIRVNAVRPGLTRSNATGEMLQAPGVPELFMPEFPLGRLGEPIDIAQAVRYLAGPESSWVTGQSFAVDGGNELRKNPDLAPLLAAMQRAAEAPITNQETM